MYRVILIVSFLLMGCTNSIGFLPELHRARPVTAMQECAQITPLKSGTFEEIVLRLGEVSTMYHEQCRRKQELSDWIMEEK